MNRPTSCDKEFSLPNSLVVSPAAPNSPVNGVRYGKLQETAKFEWLETTTSVADEQSARKPRGMALRAGNSNRKELSLNDHLYSQKRYSCEPTSVIETEAAPNEVAKLFPNLRQGGQFYLSNRCQDDLVERTLQVYMQFA